MLRTLFCAISLVPSLALAQSPAARGSLIIAANRLIPIVAYSANSAGSDPNKSTTKVTTFSLLGNPLSFFQSIYNVPRLGLDYVVADSFTVGADATVFVTASASRQSGGSASQDQDKITVLGISPRVGYMGAISSKAWFWPRLGITYFTFNDSPPQGSSSTVNQLGADFEVLLVLAPFEHVGITLGPVVDVPLSGSSSVGASPSIDTAQLHVGLTAGLGFWF